jgi:hypothetical protein
MKSPFAIRMGNSTFREDGFREALAGGNPISKPENIYDAEFNEGFCIGRDALLRAAPDLMDCLREMLKLHIAHHNDPIHARARKAIASI